MLVRFAYLSLIDPRKGIRLFPIPLSNGWVKEILERESTILILIPFFSNSLFYLYIPLWFGKHAFRDFESSLGFCLSHLQL